MIRNLIIIFATLALTSCAIQEGLRYPPSKWVKDEDRKPIAEPAKNMTAYDISEADEEIYDQLENVMSFRYKLNVSNNFGATGKQEALNTDNFDEVADSTWFTNQIGRFNQFSFVNNKPCLDKNSNFSVIRIKQTPTGIPHIIVKDSAQNMYILKFDPPKLTGLLTSAEYVADMILKEAGYNTPESFLMDIDLDDLMLAENAKKRGKYGKMEKLSEQEFVSIKDKIGGKGKVRTLVTKIPDGTIIGPFVFSGRRYGDKNDRIPDEHRRELRGYKIFSSWLNLSSFGAADTLDVFVPLAENGNGYLTHYLFDLDSVFGNIGDLQNDKEVNTGIDKKQVLTSLFSFGLYQNSNNDVKDKDDFSYLPYKDFDPGRWRSKIQNAAFIYMTEIDAFWAAKIIMCFSDKDIEEIVNKAEYSDKLFKDNLIKAIIKRRDKVGEYWFSKLTPLDNFYLDDKGDSLVINFDDLGVKYGFVEQGAMDYSYMLYTSYGRAELIPWATTKDGSVVISPEVAKLIEKDRIYSLKIQAKEQNEEWWRTPVKLYLKRTNDGIILVGLTRKVK